jgi:hypothetical protein
MIDPSQVQGMVDAMAPAVGAAPPGPPADPSLPQQGPVMAAPAQAEPKKPPMVLPSSLVKSLAQGYVDMTKSMAQSLTQQVGVPEEFERFQLRDQVSAWYKRDVRQDPYALKQEGLSPVEIRDKVYPLRRVLLKLAGPRPRDKSDFARRMKAERAKSATL